MVPHVISFAQKGHFRKFILFCFFFCQISFLFFFIYFSSSLTAVLKNSRNFPFFSASRVEISYGSLLFLFISSFLTPPALTLSVSSPSFIRFCQKFHAQCSASRTRTGELFLDKTWKWYSSWVQSFSSNQLLY